MKLAILPYSDMVLLSYAVDKEIADDIFRGKIGEELDKSDKVSNFIEIDSSSIEVNMVSGDTYIVNEDKYGVDNTYFFIWVQDDSLH